jgi:hypothetical protein
MMANRILVVAGLSILASAGTASAEDFLQNRWKPDQYLNIERGPIESTPIQMDWWSAMWAIEPAPGTASASATMTTAAPSADDGASISCPPAPQSALPAGWSLKGNATLSKAEVKRSIGAAQSLVCTYAGADSARPLLVLEKAMPASPACVVDPNSNSFSCR